MEDVDNEVLQGLGATKEAGYTDKLPRGYLSISQVTQYTKCGMAYYFRYVLERFVPTNSYMAQGSALHKAAEKLHLALMSGEVPPLAYVEAAYDGAHGEFFDPNRDVIIMEDDIDAGKIKDLGMSMMRVYYDAARGAYTDPETKKPYRALYPVAVERVVRTMVTPPEGDPVPFLGVIDLEEPSTVRDLKTKRKMGTQGEADNSLQLTLYASFTDKVDVSIDQLVRPTRTLGPRYVRRESKRSPQEIAHGKQIVSEVAQDISVGRFRRTMPDNWWCSENWCAYWSECRGKKS